MLALRAIPWAAILVQAPALVRAADAVLFRVKDPPLDVPRPDDMQRVLTRIEALERHTRANADLLNQVTSQVAALTTATEVLAARLRWLWAVGMLSAALAAIALAAALGSR
jgi:hypothetical protein